jgi:hypothetical protein
VTPRRRFRSLFVLPIAALVVMTLMAVPGNATFAKKYDLKILPATAVAGADTTFTATYTNKSLYKIGSTELTVPAGFSVLSATSTKGTVTTTASSVKVLNTSLSLNASFTITVNARLTCAAATASWTAVTKEGSSFTGALFALNNPGSAQKTTVTGTCSLTFVNQPNDTGVGDTINAPEGISVRALNGASQPVSGVAIAMTATGPGSLSGTSPVSTSGSPAAAAFTDLAVDAEGTYTLTATAAGYASATSEEFVVAGAVLGCDAEGGDSYPTQFGGAADSVDLERQVGACGVDIPVTITVNPTNVEVLKPSVEGTAFTMTIAWTVETPVNPLPATTVDYTGDDPHPMQFCLADGDDDGYPDQPAGEFWCITNQTIDLIPSGPDAGKIQLTESYFGAGDPKFART